MRNVEVDSAIMSIRGWEEIWEVQRRWRRHAQSGAGRGKVGDLLRRLSRRRVHVLVGRVGRVVMKWPRGRVREGGRRREVDSCRRVRRSTVVELR